MAQPNQQRPRRGRSRTVLLSAILPGLLFLGGCRGDDQAELDRLRKENAALRAGSETGAAMAEPGSAPPEKLAHFELDPLRSTLAGLLPGDRLGTARERFGPETRSRSWRSEGRIQTQYEWELEPGLFLRLNAESDGVLKKIAVALDGTRPTNIRTFEGFRIGSETFIGLQKRFPEPLGTYVQFWGAQGLYTIIQRRSVPEAGRYMEFAFLMPANLSPGQLNRIGQEVQRSHDGEVLEHYLKDRTPYQVALVWEALGRGR